MIFTVKKHFQYPYGIIECRRIRQINRSGHLPLFVSLLKTDRDKTLLDIRIWINDKPTKSGIFITHSAGSLLMDILKRFLDNDEFTDPDEDRQYMLYNMPSEGYESKRETI